MNVDLFSSTYTDKGTRRNIPFIACFINSSCICLDLGPVVFGYDKEKANFHKNQIQVRLFIFRYFDLIYRHYWMERSSKILRFFNPH
jgi:hypothetical protein